MATDASYESESAPNSPQGASRDQDVCEPPLALPQEKQRGKKRQWVSDTFQSFMGSVGGGSDSGPDAAVKAVAKASRGADRATAQELERLLGEVSSYEGRLDNLLDFSSSIPDRENSGSDGDGDGDGDGELQQDEDDGLLRGMRGAFGPAYPFRCGFGTVIVLQCHVSAESRQFSAVSSFFCAGSVHTA